MRYGVFLGVVLALCVATVAPAATADRHAGYYYPPPATTEVYKARTLTLPDTNREVRLGFIVGMTQQMLSQPYPPQFVIFAKGDDAEKLIIVSLRDGYIDTLYRGRALFAMLTSVARSTQFLIELGVAEFFTFFDLAKLLGFTRITISDGDTFAHQVDIE
ncbi:MAG: molybdopterin-guanine dinucleotide biosynthesis protein A [Alphaproteobacteria bacterium]